MLCFVGLVDDIFVLKPGQKILGQILAAITLLLVGILPDLTQIINMLYIPRSYLALERLLEILVVIFFVLGATNSLNLLDGLDGLCGGVTAIITVAMLLLSVQLGNLGI